MSCWQSEVERTVEERAERREGAIGSGAMRTAAAKGAPRPHDLVAALAVVMLPSAFLSTATATAAAASCASSSSALTAAATGAIYEASFETFLSLRVA